MRGDQLTRLLKMLGLLSGKIGRTQDQLASELGVTKRTIQRDLDALQGAGVPVLSDMRDGSVLWRLIDHTRQSPDFFLTLPELMALYFSRDLLQVLRGSPMQESLGTALEKIGARIPASGHDLLRRLREQTAVSVSGWKDYSRSYETIHALNRAIGRQLTVRVNHRPLTAPEATTRAVDPYRLWYAGGGLYLIGFDHAKKAIRTFAVERISRVVTTSQRFAVQDGFDFDAYTRTAFPVHGGEPQLVRIRFSSEQAPYIMERHWHDSQRLTPQEDGSVVLELQIGNLWEVRRWLIGWGADGEVLEPAALRDWVTAECEAMLRGQGPLDRESNN